MTETMRAWRKANAYVRSGQHSKAIHWLSRVQVILDSGRPSRPRRTNTGFMLAAAFVLVLIWVGSG
jgi:hypothetical protein